MFFVAAMVASSAVRDTQHKTEEVFFTLPITKVPYLFGRFAGSVVAAISTGAAEPLGIALGSLMPWLDAERLSPFAPGVYAFSLFALYAPNVILVSCACCSRSRRRRAACSSPTAAWWGSWWRTPAGALATDVSNARAATMIDPLGIGAFGIVTRYWTVFDRNSENSVHRRTFPRQPPAVAGSGRSALRLHLLALRNCTAGRGVGRWRRRQGHGRDGLACVRSARCVRSACCARSVRCAPAPPRRHGDAPGLRYGHRVAATAALGGDGSAAGGAQPGVPGDRRVRRPERGRQRGSDRRPVRHRGLPGHAPDGVDPRGLVDVPARHRGVLRRRDRVPRAIARHR